MNGIEKITARIETDSKAEVAAILADGQAKADAIRADYAAQAASAAQSATQAGENAAQLRQERLVSAAQMEAKKLLLTTKQTCLDEAFAAAKKQLLTLPDDQYAQLLAKLAVKASRTGSEEILLNKADRERVGDLVVSKANALLQSGKLTLANETREMEGGLTLRSGNVEVNCAFETQLRVLREEMAAEIAGILFA